MVACPGCGLTLSSERISFAHRYNASAGCWELFGELSAYHYSRLDPTFTHQLAVDAYGAQHSGPDTPTISTAFALIGLYLAIEHGRTGLEVQRAHMILAKQGITWPQLDRPESLGEVTVEDVLLADDDEHDAILANWARSVWAGWDESHEWVRDASKGLI